MIGILNQCFDLRVTNPSDSQAEETQEVADDIDKLYDEVKKFHDMAANDRLVGMDNTC